MAAINIVGAENLDGRVDVAHALGSAGTAMYIYDLLPGQPGGPYRYEYEEECLLVVDGSVVLRTDREHTLERGDLICFPPGPASAQRSRRADP
jgi:uncharacterized cupin superfamily protein